MNRAIVFLKDWSSIFTKVLFMNTNTGMKQAFGGYLPRGIPPDELIGKKLKQDGRKRFCRKCRCPLNRYNRNQTCDPCGGSAITRFLDGS